MAPVFHWRLPGLLFITLLSTRSFLKIVLVFLGSVVVSMLGWGAGRFALFTSAGGRRRELSKETLSRAQTGTPLHVPEAGVWLLKRTGNSEVLALDDRCTHLGCRYTWNGKTKHFECPCHGSRFDINGEITRGPATRPLQRMTVHKKPDGNLKLVRASRDDEH